MCDTNVRMHMTIRSAIPEDAERISEVRVRAWRFAYGSILPSEYLRDLDPLENIARLREALRNPGPERRYRVSVAAGSVVGFSVLGPPRYSTQEDTIELWALNVDPDAWRGGHGRSLVHQAIEDASDVRATSVELWCISRNQPARSLYESCKFRVSGRERTTSLLTGYPIHEVLYQYAF